MKASGEFFIFYFGFGPRFRPKSWHSERGPQLLDGPGLELRKKIRLINGPGLGFQGKPAGRVRVWKNPTRT